MASNQTATNATLDELNLNDFADFLEQPGNTLYNKPGLIDFTIVAIVVAVVSIVLRFWARYLATGWKFRWVDCSYTKGMAAILTPSAGMTGSLSRLWYASHRRLTKGNCV